MIGSDVQDTFDHFMKAYWNQMGPEVYGDFVNAVKMAIVYESDIYSNRLCRAFKILLSENLCAESAQIAMKSEILWEFWKKYDIVISRSECNIAISILDIK